MPCGQCIDCRLEKSRRWAIRCVHESSLYDDNCVITLTYDDDHLPPGGSLVKKDFQEFIAKLRDRVGYGKVRYFYCGEYGELGRRPHFHACLFNFDFVDKYPWRRSESGDQCYRSPLLEDLWNKGNSEIGSLTFEMAAYVARYITKKVTGDGADVHYDGRLPEYCDMSRRPGIGKPWFDKYMNDVYPRDKVVIRGREMRPPPYYDRLLEKIGVDFYDPLSIVKRKRKHAAMEFAKREDIDLRWMVREEAKFLSFKLLKRGLENA